MPLPRLTYFASRGLAEPIRLVLAEAGVEYEERSLGVYQAGVPSPELAALKASGALAFDSVPLWEEGDLRVVQSWAILRHLARAHGLYGANEHEATRCDEIIAGIEDTRTEMRRLAAAAPEARPAVRDELTRVSLPRWFGYFERLLVANAGAASFLVGAQVTLADIVVWYLLEAVADNGFIEALAECPKLAAFAQHFAQRPAIARHVASPKRFPRQPLPG